MRTMKRLSSSLVIVALLLMSVPASYASNSKPQASRSRAGATEQDLNQACREALAELKFRREAEATLKQQVDELKALGAAKDERIAHLEAAIVKYEAAVQARTQAETFVAELRSNYEKQVANAEKQLAIEQGKTNFWRTMAKVGVVVGLVVGGVIGYVVGDQ